MGGLHCFLVLMQNEIRRACIPQRHFPWAPPMPSAFSSLLNRGYLKRLSSVLFDGCSSSSHQLKGGFSPSPSPRLSLLTLVTKPFGHHSNDIQLHASGTAEPLMTPSLRFWWAQEFDEFNRMRRHAQNRHLKLVAEARGLPYWLPTIDHTSQWAVQTDIRRYSDILFVF